MRLPSGAVLQPFLHAFTGTNLPPYLRKACPPNTLHFNCPPEASWGGLAIDVAGRTRSVALEAVGGPTNGMMPAYFDREFTLSVEATCQDLGKYRSICWRASSGGSTKAEFIP